jgi:hypothetical protein
MSKALAQTAAEYFGVHREPRTSIPLGRGAVAIVCPRDGRLALMTYEDAKPPRATYTWLTEKMRRDLVAALGQEQT